MATTYNSDNNDFLTMLNDTVSNGGYTASSGKTYPPSTKVQCVKNESICRDIKRQLANGRSTDLPLDALKALTNVIDAMTALKPHLTEFEASEKEIRDAYRAKQDN